MCSSCVFTGTGVHAKLVICCVCIDSSTYIKNVFYGFYFKIKNVFIIGLNVFNVCDSVLYVVLYFVLHSVLYCLLLYFMLYYVSSSVLYWTKKVTFIACGEMIEKLVRRTAQWHLRR